MIRWIGGYGKCIEIIFMTHTHAYNMGGRMRMKKKCKNSHMMKKDHCELKIIGIDTPYPENTFALQKI